MSSSPLHRKAAELNAACAVPAPNWHERRKETIKSHGLSVETAVQALRTMGALILQGRISTDLFIEERLDLTNTNPAEMVGHISCMFIPATKVTRRPATGLGFSWSPDTALQMNFLFKDTYDYKRKEAARPAPTGSVRLHTTVSTWGRLEDEETAAICALGNGSNTYAEYGDRGHHRHGTLISALREPGESLTQNDIETILAATAPHVLNYFALTNKDHLAAQQTAGNFTTKTGY